MSWVQTKSPYNLLVSQAVELNAPKKQTLSLRQHLNKDKFQIFQTRLIQYTINTPAVMID